MSKKQTRLGAKGIFNSILQGLYGIGKQILNHFRRDNEQWDSQQIIDRLEAMSEAELKNIRKTIDGVYETKFEDTGFGFINTDGYRALLRERQQYVRTVNRGYNVIVNSISGNRLQIGRQTQDLLRMTTLKTLEQGFLQGEPSVFFRANFKQELIKNGVVTGIKTADSEIRAMLQDFTSKIPIYNDNGVMKFILLNKNGQPQRFRIDYYSELIAQTTVAEAQWSGEIDRAIKVVNTDFVKVNKPNSDSHYRQTNDPGCLAINGKVFAVTRKVQQNGVWGATGASGRFYPHISTAVPGVYLKPHPLCRHFITAIPSRFV